MPSSVIIRFSYVQHVNIWLHAEEAAVELAEVVRLFTTDELDKLVPFDPRVSEDAQFNLGVCLTRLAMLDEAEKIFQKLAASPRRASAAMENLHTIAQLRKLQSDGSESSGSVGS